MSWWGILGIVAFEARRGMTAGRWAVWGILAAFPILLMLFVMNFMEFALPDVTVGTFCFSLVSQVACPMALLLMVTSVVNGELEGRTWSYLSTRPNGRASLVLGKLLLAVTVSVSLGAVSVTGICLSREAISMRFWLSELAVMVLACLSYGGLFMLIGTWVQKRAMAGALVYMLLIEGVVSLIPATVNQFTISYRLRSLLFSWMDWRPPEHLQHFVELNQNGWQIAALAGYFIFTVGLSLVRVRWGEYSAHVEAA